MKKTSTTIASVINNPSMQRVHKIEYGRKTIKIGDYTFPSDYSAFCTTHDGFVYVVRLAQEFRKKFGDKIEESVLASLDIRRFLLNRLKELMD